MTSQMRRLSAVGRLEKVRGILSEYASVVIPARSRKQTAVVRNATRRENKMLATIITSR